MRTVSVIVPCYQNEGSIPALTERLLSLRERLKDRLELRFVFVNDGSTDSTLDVLLRFRQAHPEGCRVVNLTRNFGSYNAFLAGMEYSEADAHVHLHADLQDPPELIEDMTMHWLAGEKLVIAYRIAREDGSIFSTLYHALVQRYAIRGIPSGGFDLMLFDEQLRQEVVRISEKSTNVVYLISWLGFPFKAIPYKRLKRESGESQWKWSKKVRLFFDTFFSFSDIPASAVRWMSAMLMVLAAAAVVMALWYGSPSRAELLLAIVAAMIALLGLIGVILCEYLVRIHETVRRRPNAVVESVHG